MRKKLQWFVKHWEMRIDLRLYKCCLMVKNAVVRYWRGLRLHNLLFHNEKHPMLDTPDDFIGDGNEGMFVFQKEM